MSKILVLEFLCVCVCVCVYRAVRAAAGVSNPVPKMSRASDPMLDCFQIQHNGSASSRCSNVKAIPASSESAMAVAVNIRLTGIIVEQGAKRPPAMFTPYTGARIPNAGLCVKSTAVWSTSGTRAVRSDAMSRSAFSNVPPMNGCG